ncbi:MAG TPA: hypothetical protein VH680_14120 [Gemmatimonadales bacterium]|jgi:hypothetical protein
MSHRITYPLRCAALSLPAVLSLALAVCSGDRDVARPDSDPVSRAHRG